MMVRVKCLAAALVAALLVVAPSSVALGQTASGPPPTTAPATPPPSLPPGLPTITPPTAPSTDPEARLLAGTAIGRDQGDVQDATERLQLARLALAQATAHTAQTAVARDFAQAAFDDATETVRKAGRLTNSRDVSPTVLGDSVLTTDEIVGWYKSEGVVGYTAGVDLLTLAGYYVDESKTEQVRGDV